jgi:pteridine reductase
MVLKMAGKSALITGGAHGLGLAVARRLAQRGASLALHYFSTPLAEVERVRAELVGLGAAGVLVERADFRKPGEISQMFQRLNNSLQSLDILVNSAGVLLRKPLTETDADDWQSVIALHVVAPAECLRRAVRMGCTDVINIVDIAWDKAWRNHAAYVASKSALAAYTKVAARELAPTVRVNGVAPGLISTPPEAGDSYDSVLRRIPFGATGSPDDVARTVELLLDSPRYLTGQIIAVDGGLSLA